MMQGMVIDMEEAWLQALAQVKIFLGGTAEMAFRVPKAERHRLIEPVRKRFGTARHGWAGTDVWLRDIERMTRLVRPYRKDGIAVEPAPRAPNHGFTRRLTATDAAVLAEMAVRLASWIPYE